MNTPIDVIIDVFKQKASAIEDEFAAQFVETGGKVTPELGELDGRANGLREAAEFLEDMQKLFS